MSAETSSAQEERKESAAAWFAELRDRLCAALEAIEDAAVNESEGAAPAGRFERTPWQRPGGGGGIMAVMRGRVLEKAGVNVSTVHGEFAPEFRREIPGAEEDPRFWASGVSVVVHPASPHVPAAHMNTRYIVTVEGWFGGGADLTPLTPDDTDTASFHAALRGACDGYEPGAHARFKKWCDEYFHLSPTAASRVASAASSTTAFVAPTGTATSPSPRPWAVPSSRPTRPSSAAIWTRRGRAAEREAQLVHRGRYVEFNLLYDRGTRFGLETGGNPEAILMSLPPVVKWP